MAGCTPQPPKIDPPTITLAGPKSFSQGEFGITLTEDFKETLQREGFASYQSRYINVHVYRAHKIFYGSVEDYIGFLISANDIDMIGGIKRDGDLTYFEFKYTGMVRSTCYVIEDSETYYFVEFITSNYAAAFPYYAEWVRSIKISEENIASAPKTFTTDEFSITLTEDFEPLDYEGYLAVYQSKHGVVYIISGRKGSYASVSEYVSDITKAYEIDVIGEIKTDGGITHYEYEGEFASGNFPCISYVIEGAERFYQIDFVSADNSSLLPEYEKWVKSIVIGEDIPEPEPQTIETNRFSITLNDEFYTLSDESDETLIASQDVRVYVFSEPLALFPENSTEKDYAELIIKDNELNVIGEISEKDGLTCFEYHPDITLPYRHIAYIFKSNDSFVVAEFEMLEGLYPSYEELCREWIKSFEIKFNTSGS